MSIASRTRRSLAHWWSGAASAPKSGNPTIGYLASQYPAPSHTFIAREVSALRRAGVPVSTFSVRPPSTKELLSERDVDDHRSTGYVLPARPARVLAAHARAVWRRPRGYTDALRASLQHRTEGGRALLWALFYFAEGIVLAEQLERAEVTHLHSHFANAASHVALAATRYLGIGWSLTLHGPFDFEHPAAPLLQQKLEAVRFAAVVTHFGRSQAMRHSDPALWTKLFVARCGVELGAFPERAPRAAGRPLRVLSVGRLVPEKGQVGLVEAFGLALDGGLDAELHLIGDGPDRQRVEQKVRELGLGERVRFLGLMSSPAVLEEMARADIFVMGSFNEGLPVVLMEALALEVPAVAPTIAGIPELVVHEQTGLLYRPGDWPGLAAALVRLGKDPELAQALGRRGRERVLAEFDIERAVEPLLARFREELARHAS